MRGFHAAADASKSAPTTEKAGSGARRARALSEAMRPNQHNARDGQNRSEGSGVWASSRLETARLDLVSWLQAGFGR